MQLKYLSEDKPFGYTFKVNLYNNSSLKDIDICSKSQKVIINLAFNLALYKQLQLGDIAPFQMDEPDDGFTPLHRDKLLELVALLIDQKSIRQLFLVNHHTALFDAFADSDVVCINSDGIVTPNVYNQNVKIS